MVVPERIVSVDCLFLSSNANHTEIDLEVTVTSGSSSKLRVRESKEISNTSGLGVSISPSYRGDFVPIGDRSNDSQSVPILKFSQLRKRHGVWKLEPVP